MRTDGDAGLQNLIIWVNYEITENGYKGRWRHFSFSARHKRYHILAELMIFKGIWTWASMASLLGCHAYARYERPVITTVWECVLISVIHCNIHICSKSPLCRIQDARFQCLIIINMNESINQSNHSISLSLINQQTLIHLLSLSSSSFLLLLRRPCSASYRIHAATCKSMQSVRCSLNIDSFWANEAAQHGSFVEVAPPTTYT